MKEPVIDANTGAELDPKKVAAARATELAWCNDKRCMKRCVKRSMGRSAMKKGETTDNLKWIDRNTGDQENENYCIAHVP